MVRINLVNPRLLSDKHLVAEYFEIIVFFSYVRKHPSGPVPAKFCLGKGHRSFFKNKLKYLKKRHELIKKEMRRRGFKARKSVSLKGLKGVNDWMPCSRDLRIIKKRIVQKVKPGHRYYRQRKPKKFFVKLIKKEK